jgi:Protein of unknown function (DUF2934)
MEDREQRIREIAYRIWEDEGRQSDQADRHWQMAELIVAEEDAERARLMPQAHREPKAA